MTHYKDGTYTETGEYAKGKNSIIIALDLKDDTITTVAVTPMATNKTSLGLQKRFAVAIAEEVVGRSINDVHLDKLAGSSLTTQGFNDAIEKIKQHSHL
jgi:uncharacterized protein with FMN-binding domain